MEILAGNINIKNEPWEPYDERICAFLEAWSEAIRKDGKNRAYSDVMSFAFYIRRGSIQKRKNHYNNVADNHIRLGRGISFHIAPSNVPINCMYTLVFGLLSGCTCVVRLPRKTFPQIDAINAALLNVINSDEFSCMKSRILLIRYERNETLSNEFTRCVSPQTTYTEYFSYICNVRVIWGGDDTINEIRKYSIPPRAIELTFADRYSFGMISIDFLEKASDDELEKLAKSFYNDTYLMDQNACSAPHLILWMKDNAPSHSEDVYKQTTADNTDKSFQRVRERFWNAVTKEAAKYELSDIKVSEKFSDLCEFTGDHRELCKRVKKYAGNLLYTCEINYIPDDVASICRGRFGMFFEYVMDFKFDDETREILSPLGDEKVQTCATYGIDTGSMPEFVRNYNFNGIDRIVPFGKTLDIDVYWDGYDIVSQMSRCICF